MSITNLSPKQLRQAADLKERIDGLQAKLNEILGSELFISTANGTPQAPKTGRRKMSAEGRARISAAQKARWAAIRGESGSKAAPAKTQVKPKRYISPALRKARSESMKARWAKARRAGKSRP
jgi:hypothetical protein